MIVSRSRIMHPQSPLLTIGGTVLKESDDLVILWVTFDSKTTFEKHLRSVSRAASQRLGILKKSWRVFHDRSLLGGCFRGFVLPFLEYSCAVWCSAAIRILNYWTGSQWFRFLTGGVFECDIAHRRSVAVLCMLYKIRCKAMHPLNGALPIPYVPVRVIRGALVKQASVHLWTASLQNLAVQQDFYSPLGVPVEWSCKLRIRWCGTGGFQEQGQCFFIGSFPSIFLLALFLLALRCSFPSIVFYSFSLLFFVAGVFGM